MTIHPSHPINYSRNVTYLPPMDNQPHVVTHPFGLSLRWPYHETPTPEPHRVIRCYDGDTIKASRDGQAYLIRIVGLDAPEIHTRSGKPQPFAFESRAALVNLIHGMWVWPFPTNHQPARDHFGRILAHVTRCSDMLNVAHEMIRIGHARAHPNYPHEWSEQYRLAQQWAIFHRRGLWAFSPPIPTALSALEDGTQDEDPPSS